MSVQLQNTSRKVSFAIILTAGLVAGTLDISSAFIDYYIGTGKNPLGILNYVASGAFGKSTPFGNTGMMIAGLVFHYIIAFSFTIFFFWLYTRIPFLSANRILTGLLYGIFVWLIMNLIVVQLSNAPHAAIKDMKLARVTKSMLILIFMIGMPLSFIAYNYFYGKNKRNA